MGEVLDPAQDYLLLPGTSWQQLEEARFQARHVVCAFDNVLHAAGHVRDRASLPRQSEYLLVWDMAPLHSGLHKCLAQAQPLPAHDTDAAELRIPSALMSNRVDIALLLEATCHQFNVQAIRRGLQASPTSLYRGSKLGLPLREATPVAEGAMHLVLGVLAQALVNQHRPGFL